LPRQSKKQRVWDTILNVNGEWTSTRALADQANVSIYEMVPFLIQARRMQILECHSRTYRDNYGFKHKITFWRKIKS